MFFVIQSGVVICSYVSVQRQNYMFHLIYVSTSPISPRKQPLYFKIYNRYIIVGFELVDGFFFFYLNLAVYGNLTDRERSTIFV